MRTVKTAAQLTGLTIKAIRHYERIGLLPQASREANGYRIYSEDDIARLRQIRYFRDLQFSLPEIAALLDASPGEVRVAMNSQLTRMEAQLREYNSICNTLRAALRGRNPADRSPLPVRAVHNCAIVTIDLQNDMTEGGALPCKRIYNILPRLKMLFAQAREAGIPVVYVCDEHQRGDPELQHWCDHCMAGTWGAQIIPEIAPEPEDYVVKKNVFDGFRDSDLQRVLDSLHVNTILFTGWRSHVCVAQTAIEAFHRGYRVFVAQDGVDSTTQSEHEFGLNMLLANYAVEAVTCAEAIDVLLAAAHPPAAPNMPAG